MKKLLKYLPIIFLVLVAGVVLFLIKDVNFEILNPAGQVATEQKQLIILTVLLSAIIVVPVFTMTFMIVWKYRVSNTKNKNKKYSPNWDGNKWAESIWWGVPLILILILSGVIWATSHKLDPYKPLNSEKEALNVQVIALNWKWLFIYPEQNIATINYLQIPEDTPINFEITADAPMNSFWIPQLGGQVYAMPGMSTKIHLMADKIGKYSGKSANLSGEGFAGMKFTAEAVSTNDFESWTNTVTEQASNLDYSSYLKLVEPTKNHAATTYRLSDSGLYDKVVMKYMMPNHVGGEHETEHNEGTHGY